MHLLRLSVRSPAPLKYMTTFRLKDLQLFRGESKVAFEIAFEFDSNNKKTKRAHGATVIVLIHTKRKKANDAITFLHINLYLFIKYHGICQRWAQNTTSAQNSVRLNDIQTYNIPLLYTTQIWVYNYVQAKFDFGSFHKLSITERHQKNIRSKIT